MVRQAPVICVMAPPIHLGAWSMALMLWLPFELLLLLQCCRKYINTKITSCFEVVVINHRRACAARVTVLALCVCLSVCLCVCLLPL